MHRDPQHQAYVVEEDCHMVQQLLDDVSHDGYPGRRDFAWLIGLLSYRKATDPRDKIYAVMNLVAAEQRPSFLVDYQMPVVDVYKMDTEHVLFQAEQRLNILQNCTWTENHPIRFAERWPSWVPIWGNIKHAYICGVHPEQFLPADGIPLQAWKASTDVLCIKGVAVGPISAQADCPWDQPIPPSKRFNDAWSLTREHADPSPDCEPLALQLIWTLLCVEADDHRADEQAYLHRKYGFGFIEYYCFLLAEEKVAQIESDLMDAVVMAMGGLLTEPFNRANPRHAALAAQWKAKVEEKGFDPDLMLYCQDMSARNQSTDAKLLASFLTHAWFNEEGIDSYPAYFQEAWLACGDDHRFFVTNNGRIGMSPREAQSGDIVAVLFGSSVPFILRPSGSEYLIVGSCYCYGLMHGEYVRTLKESSKLEESIRTFALR
ncbi:hypothetical protein BAUCODRAFT_336406 [Baudoinia panamericana UAMH 10762]|uniref:Heterokaryon incompatibility domain-containing protein n=1 Tax=Baudoinia panamericana (strain UAMH 10762) TaxID=717646 RepID=M2LXJ8_BAUPA|nr:uncharacterized protein BAUCODRAFT_336406 [Baudoinia panamericana UAMH 10762]EMC99422.1 hypothetical protein BAUCODRAFT_336406 [Baudoinia panamericana UAMH 10762]